MSYEQRLLTIWRYPLSFGGIVAMVGMGVLFAVGSFGLPYWMLAVVSFWGYMFGQVQSTARGIDDIGPPNFSTLAESVFGVLFRAFIATSASWLPLIFYLIAYKPTLFDALVNPVVWFFVLFGLVNVPVAIMGAAVETPLTKLLNPLWLVHCVALLGRSYWIAVSVLGALTALQCVVLVLGYYIVQISLPLLPIGVAIAVTLLAYIPFLMARTVGLLLYVCGDKLGYGDPNDYLERIVTERPRGSLPAPKLSAADAENAPSAENGRPIEVDF